MVVTEVRVSPSTEEIAQEEFKELEQQRVLGIVPNFYVSYVGEAAPLSPKRKFELALKATTDPVTTKPSLRLPGWNKPPIALAVMAKARKATPSAMALLVQTLLPDYGSEERSCLPFSSRILGTSIREAVPSVPDSCTLSLDPSFVKGTINAGSPIIPLSSATSLPAVFRICIYPKETVTERR